MSDDDLDKRLISTDRGLGHDLSETPISPPTTPGADWFGPRTPMNPTAPEEVAGRVRDYLVGVNLQTLARGEEPVSFQELRYFSDVEVVRLLIEKRKDQLVRLKWTVRAKKRHRVDTSLLDYVQSFFGQPHFEHDFASFVRILAEDLLVLDAPTIFLDRFPNGKLKELRPIDGGIVKRIIDDWGQLPRPIEWSSGQPFSWCGDTIDRANFRSKGWHYDSASGLIYPPSYVAILKGLPATSYSTKQISQRRFNPRSNSTYGKSVVETIMRTIATASQRARSQLDYFTEGNQPESIYGLPESWGPQQVQQWQDYWDNLLVGDLEKRRRMKFIAGDGKFTPIKEPVLKGEIDEWLARICCFAFSYPPTAFIKENNRATAEQRDKTAEEEGLQPVKLFFASWFNQLIRDEFNTDSIEFAWLEEEETNQELESQIVDRLTAAGLITVNEGRSRLGLEPLADPAANTPMVRTANGYVAIGGHEQEAAPAAGNVVDIRQRSR